jgi:uncharacterized repeat protein (TIGR01451 family)
MSCIANLRTIYACVGTCALAILPNLTAASLNNSREKLDQNYGRLSLAFEPNQGQTAALEPFLVHLRDGLVQLRPDGLLFKLPYRDSETKSVYTDTVKLRFQGANQTAPMAGREILPGKSNYFIGNDPTQWRTDVPQYARVHTDDVYPKIAVDFYATAGRLEYDFVLAPGADPSCIRLRFDGHQSVELSGEGHLIFHLRGGDLIQKRPVGYQLKGGVRHPVPVHYRMLDDQSIAFELGAYDQRLPLVIDPSFVYSTRFGGSVQDEPRGIAIDSTGAAYITGLTYSPDFPTVQPFQSRNGDIYGQTPDVFISKLNPAGTQFIYSTYLGGSRDDLPSAIAVDSLGSVYVTGSTISPDFPTVNALQPLYSGAGDAFLAKLNPAGSALTYSTFLGGSGGGNYGNAIAVDSIGSAYVAGLTGAANFPVQNAYQSHLAGGSDAFLLKVNQTGTALVFSTYFGGSGSDGISALGLEASTGNIIVAGNTQSHDLPTLNAFQNTLAPTSGGATFVSKFNSTASALIYSTYLGGSVMDEMSGLALDSSGDVYVIGGTSSTDFPVSVGAIEPFPGGLAASCFITKFGSTGNLLDSTFLGGHSGADCSAIGVDSTGNVLVTGGASGPDYPVFAAIQATFGQVTDAFLTKLSPDLASILYSTLLGINSGGSALALDASNNVYVTTFASGTYPIVNSAKIGPGGEIGVSKIVGDTTCAGTVVSPTTFIVPSSGGSGTVHVSTAATCNWNAVLNAAGPTMSSPDFVPSTPPHIGTGDFAFTVSFTEFGPNQTGHVVIAGRRVDITQTGRGCVPSLPSSVLLPYTAGNSQFIFNVNSGCPWQAQSNAPWITLTPPTSSTGYAIIQFTVAAYLAPPGSPRSGTITVNGETFTVNQSTIPPPALSISKTHLGNFPPGQQNASYTVIVSNPSSAGPTDAPVTVTETIPAGLTLVSMAGTGWSCSTNICNRSDVLNPGASYPAITVTVNVTANAPSPQVNQVTVSGGGSPSASASDLTLITSAQPRISVNHTTLNFTYTGPAILATSAGQTVVVNITDAGPNVGWTTTPSQPNILFVGAPTGTISGTGSGSFQVVAAAGPSGTVTVTLTGAVGSAQINVNVTKVDPGTPFGSFDTPADNSTGIAGAIPVTGWALDSVGVANLRIYREPLPNESGLVYIGDAVFVEDARPDVATRYPNAPNQYAAGWGYMLLTNFLPNSGGVAGLGNGTYKLHAIATNTFGTQLDLGTRTITVTNAHAQKPFGTIDTPAQGGSISGNSYVNFGWALTQNPYCIPIDGSTITVVIDGVVQGHPTYDQNRSDIANSFPGLCNSNGGVGFFYMDTTQLTNSVHTISWVAYDNQGRGDGIGSRYFTVTNSGGSTALHAESLLESGRMQGITLRKGYDLNLPAQRLKPNDQGMYVIEMEELDRIELRAGATTGRLLIGDESHPLPVGSTLKDGVFYWQAGPGFLGDYDLVLQRPNATPAHVRVLIRQKNYSGQ